MMNKTIDIQRHSLSTAERSERIALALLLAFGAVLMLVASGASGEDRLPFSASRTDRFNATLGPRATVRIENVSGDIVAVAGKSFSSVATVSVNAATQKRADEMLSRTVVEQTQDEDGYALETRWPDSSSRSERGRRYTSTRTSDARVTVKFEVTVPAGVTAVLKTVNGEVRVTDVDGELEVSSVNGDVRVSGTRRSFKARTVNGRVEAAAALLPSSASVDCRTVNGAVTLTLPKDAKFNLSASTMSGGIASTFALPARMDVEPLPAKEPREKDKNKDKEKGKEKDKDRETPRRIVIKEVGGEDVVVDMHEVQLEIEESMKEVEIAVRRGLQESEAQIFTLMPGREYSGSVGQGGASIHASTLNGSIKVLAAGTREADAKPLVSPRRTFTYPRMRMVQTSPEILSSFRRSRLPIRGRSPSCDRSSPALPARTTKTSRGATSRATFSPRRRARVTGSGTCPGVCAS